MRAANLLKVSEYPLNFFLSHTRDKFVEARLHFSEGKERGTTIRSRRRPGRSQKFSVNDLVAQSVLKRRLRVEIAVLARMEPFGNLRKCKACSISIRAGCAFVHIAEVVGLSPHLRLAGIGHQPTAVNEKPRTVRHSATRAAKAKKISVCASGELLDVTKN